MDDAGVGLDLSAAAFAAAEHDQQAQLEVPNELNDLFCGFSDIVAVAELAHVEGNLQDLDALDYSDADDLATDVLMP